MLALHRLVSRGPDGLVFESYDLSSALPSAGATLILCSWWSPLSLEAVTAPDGTWQEAQFEGDDHAHCIVSWEEIRRAIRGKFCALMLRVGAVNRRVSPSMKETRSR